MISLNEKIDVCGGDTLMLTLLDLIRSYFSSHVSQILVDGDIPSPVPPAFSLAPISCRTLNASY